MSTEQIYVFTIRCFHQRLKGCFSEEGIDVESDSYEDAKAQAIKEFRRRQPFCDDAPLEWFDFNYEFA